MSKANRKPLLEESLLTALKSVDNQIARAMERTPAEREVHGVQKWKPMEDRVEKLCELLVSEFGETYQLDSLLVFARAFVKSLTILCEELGVDSFGEIRGAYLRNFFEMMEADINRSMIIVKGETDLIM